jgi:hypothetical protein
MRAGSSRGGERDVGRHPSDPILDGARADTSPYLYDGKDFPRRQVYMPGVDPEGTVLEANALIIGPKDETETRRYMSTRPICTAEMSAEDVHRIPCCKEELAARAARTARGANPSVRSIDGAKKWLSHKFADMRYTKCKLRHTARRDSTMRAIRSMPGRRGLAGLRLAADIAASKFGRAIDAVGTLSKTAEHKLTDSDLLKVAADTAQGIGHAAAGFTSASAAMAKTSASWKRPSLWGGVGGSRRVSRRPRRRTRRTRRSANRRARAP